MNKWKRFIGPIWFLVLMCLPGTHGNNRFGGDSIPNRKVAPPAHPAFAPKPEGEEARAMEAARKEAARDYYRTHVLPSVQKGEPA